MNKISVILADDHSILRYGLRKFLASTGDIRVVGEASTGEECIDLFENKLPDVCVIDIGMPKKNGIEVATAIRKIDANARIIFLSMHSDEATLRKALAVDVNGYLSKNVPKQMILEAVRDVSKGKKIFSDKIPEYLFKSSEKDSNPRNFDDITKRESEIISLVVEGYSSPEIAEKLFISRRTVDTHRNNIMKKMDVNNTASLVRVALQYDLVNSPNSNHINECKNT